MYINEKVPIEDVFPLKDEHGNDFARRDYSAKANRDYVAAWPSPSTRPPLQPDEMPVLVQDDGIYYIAAGNSRVEAMRHLGVKFFRAVVLDDTVEEAIEKKLLETAVRTNVKEDLRGRRAGEFTRPAPPLRRRPVRERGHRPRQVPRVPHPQGSPARRGGRGPDALEWYEAVGEAEEAGDAETVEALTAASASTWRLALSQVRAKRDAESGRPPSLRPWHGPGSPWKRATRTSRGCATCQASKRPKT